MEYIDSNGEKWILAKDRELVTFVHSEYDGPEDGRCGVAFNVNGAISDIENGIEDSLA